MELSELDDVADLRLCEDLQRSVWQASETDVVPVNQLRAAQHGGGLVVGARSQGELIGFCYGFPSFRPELRPTPGLHSHMAAVLPGYRSRGVGRALKWFQRRWCLERGIDWIEWTFDPLRAANARFNLHYLGATAAEYLVDTYGPMTDALNDGLPSDRLMAFWELRSEAVARREGGPGPEPDGQASAAAGSRSAARPASQQPALMTVLRAKDDGSPGRPRLGLDDPRIRIEVPGDLDRLLALSAPLAMGWRLTVREVMSSYFEAGYVAVDFTDGAYLLRRAATEPSEAG